MPHFLAIALSFTATYRYLLIFVGTIIEGPLLMIASGFLLSQGILSLLPLYLALVAGDLLGDIVWYYVGYHLGARATTRLSGWLDITPEKIDQAKVLFHRYHEKILLISKVTLGFGLAIVTLVVAGTSKLNFKRYLVINLIGETILVAEMLAIGYFFGQIYSTIASTFRGIFLAGGAIVSIALVYGISRYAKKQLLKI